MKNFNSTQIVLSLALVNLVGLFSAYGQSVGDVFGFDNTGGDNVQDVPIHFLLYAGMFVGACLGFNKLRK